MDAASDAGGAQVLAAGGLVVDEDEAGSPLVAVVHRPRYDDWSLPKGKLHDGETFEEGAVREVEEETGFRCEPGEELRPASYLDRRGREKLVRYFRMRPASGAFVPGDEVDELRWLEPAEAMRVLDYDHDRGLVRDLVQASKEGSEPGGSP